MRLERGSGHEPGDERLTEALRALYAPPADPAYWAGLEARVLARVTGEGAGGAEWWSAFEGWVRVGLAAAGLVAVLAGLAAVRSRAEEAEVAYEAEIEAPSGVPMVVQTAARASDASTREATLQYVISY